MDGDLYLSTRDALVALYPKLSWGGLVYIDDYGSLVLENSGDSGQFPRARAVAAAARSALAKAGFRVHKEHVGSSLESLGCELGGSLVTAQILSDKAWLLEAATVQREATAPGT